MLTYEQLKERKLGICATDVASVLGLNPFKDSYDVFIEKTSKDYVFENSPSIAAQIGHYLEPLVLDLYKKQTGIDDLIIDNQLFTMKEYDFMKCHIDAYDKTNQTIVEAKTSYSNHNHEWGDIDAQHYPSRYLCQVAHECIVFESATGLPVKKGKLPVLIGQKFYIYEYARDIEFEKKLIEKCTKFWNDNVLKNVPPPRNNNENAKMYYAALVKNKSIKTNSEIDEKIKLLRTLKQDKSLIEEKIQEITNDILSFCNDSEFIVDNEDQIIAKISQVKQERFDSKAFQKDHKDLFNKFKKTIAFKSIRLP